VSNFSPYYLGCAFMVIIAGLTALSGRFLWALPFVGAAFVLYFIGMSQDLDAEDRNDAR